MRTAGERNVRISNKTVSIHRLKMCVRLLARLCVHSHSKRCSHIEVKTHTSKRGADFFGVVCSFELIRTHNSCTVKYRYSFCHPYDLRLKHGSTNKCHGIASYSVYVYFGVKNESGCIQMYTFNKNSNIFFYFSLSSL